jgi:bacterioferritin (cytochrome b1)
MFDQLVPQIPLHEAAAFFHKIKKAGWDEPPDLTGQLEGQFNVPTTEVAGFLAQVITAKFKMVMAYYTYAESMRDLAQHSVGEVFHEHAQQELSAAEYYLKRAAVLGGPVALQEVEPPPASTDPVHIVQVMMRAEQEAIALQRQLKEMVGESNPMKVEVEEKLAQDQHHLDELWQMLPSELHDAAQGAMGAPAGPADGAPPAESSGPGNEQAQAAGSKAESGVQQRGNGEKEAAMRRGLGMRMKVAAAKLGFGPPLDEYLAEQQAGQQAQGANEAEFYRGKLQELQATGQGTQQQIADLTQQLQQAQEQQAQVGTTIQAANEEAMAARDDALQHAQLEANMRLGIQKMQQQILQIASQDPSMLGSLPTDLPAGSGQGMVPGTADPNAGMPAEGMGVGQPGATPQATGPNEVPAEDGGPGAPGATKPSNGQGGSSSANPTATAGSMKIGAIRDHTAALGGAALGALYGGAKALNKGKELPARTAELESATAADDGSFAKALELAKARAGVTESEHAAQHPVRSALTGGVQGGLLGAAAGRAAHSLAGNLGQLFQ